MTQKFSMVASSFSFVFLRRNSFYDAILNLVFNFCNYVLLTGNTTGECSVSSDVDIFYFAKTIGATVVITCEDYITFHERL